MDTKASLSYVSFLGVSGLIFSIKLIEFRIQGCFSHCEGKDISFVAAGIVICDVVNCYFLRIILSELNAQKRLPCFMQSRRMLTEINCLRWSIRKNVNRITFLRSNWFKKYLKNKTMSTGTPLTPVSSKVCLVTAASAVTNNYIFYIWLVMPQRHTHIFITPGAYPGVDDGKYRERNSKMVAYKKVYL